MDDDRTGLRLSATSSRVFQLKSYPIEIPPVGRNDITPVMLSAAKRSRNIPHSDWTIIFPDYSKRVVPLDLSGTWMIRQHVEPPKPEPLFSLEHRYRNPVSTSGKAKSRRHTDEETGFLPILNQCSSGNDALVTAL
jgi:hypothetical protein